MEQGQVKYDSEDHGSRLLAVEEGNSWDTKGICVPLLDKHLKVRGI